VTPAADAELFGSPTEKDKERETLSLDYVALLQTLSPLQRAAFLCSERLGYSTAEIAKLLELTEAGVVSAVRRASEAMAHAPRASELPPPEALAAMVLAWELHDLDGLSRLLHPDAMLSMPPFDGWLHGAGALRGFFGSTRFEAFWAPRLRVKPTDANGGPALAFYRPGPDGVPLAQAIMLLRYESGRVAELCAFVGRRYFHGFEIPTEMDPVAPMIG
jgi:RNA polymerase sigma-70 factor (ECF subfamily)